MYVIYQIQTVISTLTYFDSKVTSGTTRTKWKSTKIEMYLAEIGSVVGISRQVAEKLTMITLVVHNTYLKNIDAAFWSKVMNDCILD